MLLKIDELTRSDHFFLSPEDQCFYLREFTKEGFQARLDNQRVYNLKCPINHPKAGRLHYKREAIRAASIDISEALKGLPAIAETVFIPLPPSKLPNTPEYDPRVRDMLREAEATCGIKVVDALAARASRAAAHETDNRPTVEEIASNLNVISVDWTDARYVALFDDVLVTGAQFKAASRVIHSVERKANIVGFFWARRTFP